jgi:hypothetical protein
MDLVDVGKIVGPALGAVAAWVLRTFAGGPRPKLTARWVTEDAGPYHSPWEGIALELHGRYADVQLHAVGVRWCARRRWWPGRRRCPREVYFPVPASQLPATLKTNHSVHWGWHVDQFIEEDWPKRGHEYGWAHVGRREIWPPVRPHDRRVARLWKWVLHLHKRKASRKLDRDLADASSRRQSLEPPSALEKLGQRWLQGPGDVSEVASMSPD